MWTLIVTAHNYYRKIFWANWEQMVRVCKCAYANSNGDMYGRWCACFWGIWSH